MVWQYKHVDMPISGDSEDRLNALGAEGWELVGFENISTNAQRMIFKKPVLDSSARNLGTRV